MSLKTQTSAGSTDPIIWEGGVGSFDVFGTTEDTKLEMAIAYEDGTNSDWVAVGPDTTLTGAGGGGFQLGSCLLRVTSTGTPDIEYRIITPRKN